MNKAIIAGNLGKDPTIRRKNDGGLIVSFSIATSERWRDKNTNERKEQTEWHNVVVFNENIAKIAEQYLKKGSKVIIEGKIKTRKYTDKDGVERYTTEIVIGNYDGSLHLMGERGSGGSDKPESDREGYGSTRTRDDFGRGSSGFGNGSGTSGGVGGHIDDDIPF